MSADGGVIKFGPGEVWLDPESGEFVRSMVVNMREADDRAASYGILFEGANVHEIVGARHNPRYPHRIKVWSNVDRPNPHPGEVWWTKYGSIGGDGKYLDPSNRGTDDEITVTTSAEGFAITNSGSNTGTEASGQVYGVTLDMTDVVTLLLPDGSTMGPYRLAQRPLHDPHLTAL